MDRNRRRKFGQNFLNNPAIIDAILRDLPWKAGDRLLEIGPGHGALTKGFLEGGVQIDCVEIDPQCVLELKNRFGENGPTIHNVDFMDFDLENWLEQQEAPPWCVGNLPYNMATPIISKILPHLHKMKGLMIMVQFEAAQRLLAEPSTKEYGFLTVQRATYAQAKILRKVSADNFTPKPNVLSATILLTAVPPEERLPPEMLDALVGPSFRQRRKKLTNNLKVLWAKEEIENALVEMGYSALARGEELSAQDFAKLFNVLQATNHKT